jgi:hypothetical protein
MVAEDFLRDPQVRQWLGGVEPAWTLLTLDGLRALRQEPSAVQPLSGSPTISKLMRSMPRR